MPEFDQFPSPLMLIVPEEVCNVPLLATVILPGIFKVASLSERVVGIVKSTALVSEPVLTLRAMTMPHSVLAIVINLFLEFNNNLS